MKFRTTARALAVVLTFASAAPVALTLFLLCETSKGLLILIILGLCGILFFINLFLLEKLLFNRLYEIRDRLTAFVRRRTHAPPDPETEQADVIATLSVAMLQLSGAIRKEFQQLRELDLVRQEYIGDISHELKTPIFAIEGYLETLLDGALQDKNVNKKFVKQALKNVQRLNDLVQDLLTITQLESGQLKMKKEPFRLYELILDVFEVFENKKAENLKVIVPTGGENIVVWADKEQIRRVIENLVSNAAKYGKTDGAIIVRVASTKSDKISVAIENEGEEIPAEHLPRLFERFYRVDKSRSREKGGTGLGLAIVKNLLAAHGEDVTVKSGESTGTVFSFTLPLYDSRQ